MKLFISGSPAKAVSFLKARGIEPALGNEGVLDFDLPPDWDKVMRLRFRKKLTEFGKVASRWLKEGPQEYKSIDGRFSIKKWGTREWIVYERGEAWGSWGYSDYGEREYEPLTFRSLSDALQALREFGAEYDYFIAHTIAAKFAAPDMATGDGWYNRPDERDWLRIYRDKVTDALPLLDENWSTHCLALRAVLEEMRESEERSGVFRVMQRKAFEMRASVNQEDCKEKLVIACAGCGRTQLIRRIKVIECEGYVCRGGYCDKNRQFKIPGKPGHVCEIIPGAAGSWAGWRFVAGDALPPASATRKARLDYWVNHVLLYLRVGAGLLTEGKAACAYEAIDAVYNDVPDDIVKTVIQKARQHHEFVSLNERACTFCFVRDTTGTLVRITAPLVYDVFDSPHVMAPEEVKNTVIRYCRRIGWRGRKLVKAATVSRNCKCRVSPEDAMRYVGAIPQLTSPKGPLLADCLNQLCPEGLGVSDISRPRLHRFLWETMLKHLRPGDTTNVTAPSDNSATRTEPALAPST